MTNKENWAVIKNVHIWGVPEHAKKQIKNVKPGDMMVVYVMPKRIGGIFKATSNSFESRKAIFSWGKFGREDLYPYRVKLEPVVLPKKLFPFDPLIPKLTFIVNKKLWTGHLRRAMRLIPKEDYETIKLTLARTQDE